MPNELLPHRAINQNAMSKVIKNGYKVTRHDMTCNPGNDPFQFELNKEFSVSGTIEVCYNGFHFCERLADCFGYYDFNPKNRVFEVEAWGDMDEEGNKTCAQYIKLTKELTWEQVLVMVNTGTGNSGHSNSGDRNSGDSNSGAFCTDTDPVLYLFDKPTEIKVREWENSEVVEIMGRIHPTIWVPAQIMSEEEKKAHPKWETTDGYLKTITMHEAWANMWGNLNDSTKKLFTDLPNFDSEKFEQITGIKA